MGQLEIQPAQIYFEKFERIFEIRFRPDTFCENHDCFWNRRPDGMVINNNHRTLSIPEFERSSDRNEDLLGVKEDEANEQH